MVSPRNSPNHEQSGSPIGQFRTSENSAQLQRRIEAQTVTRQQYRDWQRQQLNGNGNLTPRAHMYGPPIATRPTKPNQFTTLIDYGTRFYNPQAYPVQPYGIVPQDQRQHPGAHDTFANAGAAAPSHVAFGADRASITYPPLEPLPDVSKRWQIPTVDYETSERHHDNRSVKEQAQRIIGASNRLQAVVDSYSVPDPPHESSPPSAAVVVASPRNKGNPRNTGTCKRGVAARKPKPKMVKTKKKASADAKSKMRNRQYTPVDRPKTEAYMLVVPSRKKARPKHGIKPKDVSQVPKTSNNEQSLKDAMKAIPADSDADADGETDEDFDGKSYKVANGIARKVPRFQRLKINVPAGSGTERSTPGRPTPRRGTYPVTKIARQRDDIPTKASKSKRPRKWVAAKDLLLEPTPDDFKNKEKPESLSDLLGLLAFETASYNNNPQRQVELEAINRAIAKENIGRGVRRRALERKLAKQVDGSTEFDSPARPTRSGSVRPKRKGVDEEPGAAARPSKPKTRKTAKTGSQLVAPLVLHESSNIVPQQSEADVQGKGDTSDADCHNDADNTAADSGSAFADGEDTDIHTLKPLPSFRPLRPQPGTYIFDEHGNAVPIPKSRRGQRDSVVEMHVPEASQLAQAPSKLEKVLYVPKNMRSLLRRIEQTGLGRHMSSSTGPAMDGDKGRSAQDKGEEGGGDDSPMDAEGSTDEDVRPGRLSEPAGLLC
jgi:hypothetical protein